MIVRLDTNIVIYLIEHVPVWTPKALARFNASLKARGEIVVWDSARVECLIKPLASKDLADEARFRAFFGNPLGRMLPVSTPTMPRGSGQLLDSRRSTASIWRP